MKWFLTVINDCLAVWRAIVRLVSRRCCGCLQTHLNRLRAQFKAWILAQRDCTPVSESSTSRAPLPTYFSLFPLRGNRCYGHGLETASWVVHQCLCINRLHVRSLKMTNQRLWKPISRSTQLLRWWLNFRVLHYKLEAEGFYCIELMRMVLKRNEAFWCYS